MILLFVVSGINQDFVRFVRNTVVKKQMVVLILDDFELFGRSFKL